MAFSSWFARSRLSSRTAFALLRPSRQLHSTPKVTGGDPTAISPAKSYRRLPNWWSSSLLPLAIAVSATSFAFQNHSHPSISESSSALDSGFVFFFKKTQVSKSQRNCLIASFPFLCSDITIGGKDSTEHEIKGEYKEVPKEFIAELKTILEVLQNLNFCFSIPV